ncbi:hypothetical protein LCGC14_3104200, partial [marine sediment metagenome]
MNEMEIKVKTELESVTIVSRGNPEYRLQVVPSKSRVSRLLDDEGNPLIHVRVSTCRAADWTVFYVPRQELIDLGRALECYKEETAV